MVIVHQRIENRKTSKLNDDRYFEPCREVLHLSSKTLKARLSQILFCAASYSVLQLPSYRQHNWNMWNVAAMEEKISYDIVWPIHNHFLQHDTRLRHESELHHNVGGANATSGRRVLQQ